MENFQMGGGEVAGPSRASEDQTNVSRPTAGMRVLVQAVEGPNGTETRSVTMVNATTQVEQSAVNEYQAIDENPLDVDKERRNEDEINEIADASTESAVDEDQETQTRMIDQEIQSQMIDQESQSQVIGEEKDQNTQQSVEEQGESAKYSEEPSVDELQHSEEVTISQIQREFGDQAEELADSKVQSDEEKISSKPVVPESDLQNLECLFDDEETTVEGEAKEIPASSKKDSSDSDDCVMVFPERPKTPESVTEKATESTESASNTATLRLRLKKAAEMPSLNPAGGAIKKSTSRTESLSYKPKAVKRGM